MAEHVQATLDRMVDGLIAIRDYGQDFQSLASMTTDSSTTTATDNTTAVANAATTPAPPPLLSMDEISEIIGRRRSFEYLLRRRQPRQSDFLAYLQYEIQLYSLIQLRYRKYYQSNKAFQKFLRRQINEDNDDGTGDPPPRQYHKKPVQYVIQHIHILYQRTIRQYRYSYPLVQQYVEFCRAIQPQPQQQQGHVSPLPPHSATVTKIYQRAIRYHCTNIQLWYDMIQYEYQYYYGNHMEDRTRIATLRILFQRALRFHASNLTLWKSWWVLEWNHSRGTTTPTTTLPVLGHKETDPEVDDDDHTNHTDTNQKMPRIVFNAAIKAIRDDDQNLSFRIQCYQILHCQNNSNDDDDRNPETERLQQYILDRIITPEQSDQRFSNHELQVMVRATMCLLQQQQQQSTPPDHNPVLQVLQEAGCGDPNNNESPPSRTMIYYALQFLRSYSQYVLMRNSPHDAATTLRHIRVLVRDLYRQQQQSQMTHSSIPTTMTTKNGGVVVTDSDVVLEYVAFIMNEESNDSFEPPSSSATATATATLTTTSNRRMRYQEAMQIIQAYINSIGSTVMTPISASLFLKWAKLMIEIESCRTTSATTPHDDDDHDHEDAYSSAIAILEQAIQVHIPIHQQPDHFLLLEQLFCLHVAKVTRFGATVTTNDDHRDDVRWWTKIKDLLDQMILVGPKNVTVSTTRSTFRDVAVVHDIPNILTACRHYLPYLYENDTTQHKQYYRQLIDQMLLHPSNVIVYQWISHIQMEYRSSDETTTSSNSATGRFNVVNLLGTLVEDFTLPLGSTSNNTGTTLTTSNAFGEEVILRSSKKLSTTTNMLMVQELVEYILEHEATSLPDSKHRLLKLYDRVIFIFQQLALKVWVRYYQRQKNDNALFKSSTGSTVISTHGQIIHNNKKRSLAINSGTMHSSKMIKTDSNVSLTLVEDRKAFRIPVLDANDANFHFDEVMKLYDQYQIVHVKSGVPLVKKFQLPMKEAHKKTIIGWKDVRGIFQKLNDVDQKSWCIETNMQPSTTGLLPEKFLSPDNTKDRAYCSFVIQKSEDVYTDIVQSLPFQDFDTTRMQYETAIWFFFGRNPIGNVNMNGRPEHTDAISHSGTWHYQLSGCKRWLVRPTTELVNQLYYLDDDTTKSFCVNCQENDILMINTRLFFHQTIIPPQRTPSVSYARDFRRTDNGENQSKAKPANDESCTMTNVDGLYATTNVAKGTIIFTEVDMPDCELHRSSTDPNCEVVELEDGTSAVIARRPISSGEFFCVPESSNDEEESDVYDTETDME